MFQCQKIDEKFIKMYLLLIRPVTLKREMGAFTYNIGVMNMSANKVIQFKHFIPLFIFLNN